MSQRVPSDPVLRLCIATPFLATAAGTLANVVHAVVVNRNLFLLVRRELVVLFGVFPAALLVFGLIAFARDRRVGGVLVALAAMVLGLRTYMIHIEPNWLATRTVTIESAKVKRPLRIVHFSDLQSDGIDGNERRAVQAIIDAKPDLVIHTGDLLQPLPPLTFESEIPRVDELLRTIQPPLGFFVVGGDTDGPIDSELQRGLGGMKLLASASETVERDDARVRLLGLTLQESRDTNEPFSRDAIARFLADSRPEDFTIVMGHAPDYALVAQDQPIDLCLAGHTHGGQINIPGFGPIVTLSQVPRTWARGFNEIGKTRLNVTTGVGAEHAAGLPSLRLFCRPEITIIDIVPPGGASR